RTEATSTVTGKTVSAAASGAVASDKRSGRRASVRPVPAAPSSQRTARPLSVRKTPGVSTRPCRKFVGRTNFLHGRVETPGVFRTESGLAVRCDEGAAGTGRTLALRPERLSLATAPLAAAETVFPVTVEVASV